MRVQGSELEVQRLGCRVAGAWPRLTPRYCQREGELPGQRANTRARERERKRTGQGGGGEKERDR